MNRAYILCCALSFLVISPALVTRSEAQVTSAGLFRDSNPQFVPLTYNLDAAPGAVCTGDFNGDGKPDLAVAGFNTTGDIAVTIALGHGDGKFTFEKDFTFSSLGNARGIAAADLNRDGKVDLVVTNQGTTAGVVSVFLGNGDGTFSTGATYSAGGAGIAIADFNGDGNPDLAVPRQAGDGVDILLGNGDGTFTIGTGISLPAGSSVGLNPLVADLNHDSKLDLVLQTSYGGGFYVALGNGDGTFQPAVFYQLPDSYTGEALADFNQDGNLDVGFAGAYDYCDYIGHTLIVGVAPGNGDGTFQPAVTYTDPNVCGGFRALAADFNGDGMADLFDVDTAMLFLGNGKGVLQDGESSISWGIYTFAALTVDLNNDGAPDVVAIDGFFNRFGVGLNVSGDSETLTGSAQGQSITFTAQVTGTVSTKLPTGNVRFLDGTTTLGKVALSNGIAMFTTSTLKKGTHHISAVYSGDANYIPKTAELTVSIH